MFFKDSSSLAIIDPNLGGHDDGDGDGDDLNLAWYGDDDDGDVDDDGLNLAWYGACEVVVPRVTAAGPRKTYLDNWDWKFLSLGQVATGE